MHTDASAGPRPTFPDPLDFDHAPLWLLASEAGALARVSTRTIRRWQTLGHVRASRPAGGRVLIDRESLRRFIEGSAS